VFRGDIDTLARPLDLMFQSWRAVFHATNSALSALESVDPEAID
jgi:hypothetical protein